ncbi:amino acid adenylation domain-containing protein [Algoriphagus halophilus]|uniref:Amino acid adenylation domain-containing protein n=1 Tax=Algoriphagus halophilus TaxID=226505 RepID=A0A1N6DTN9_9BACT|nr:amino acid adenylation domain-containing protein [Algoriphagus halophilus]SIN74155.1 amino acid adenylation domain-containing protein [Algoriphagus halophilus]
MNSTSQLLSELIAIGAKETPNKIAFKSAESQISYQELESRSNQLANWLVENQVKKGDRVGILIEKNVFTAYAIYGILKAGAVLVALDPSQPSERLNTIIADCNIKIVLTIPSHQRIIDQIDTQNLLVVGSHQGVSWDTIFQLASNPPLDLDIEPSDLAYILYTSGSTGEPKGIVHTHSSGMAYARQSTLLYEVSENDTIGNVASLHFDQSTFGYFSAMYAGCTTYIFNTSELVMLGSFCEAVRANGITILYSVPSLFISLIEGGFDLDFPSLRWIKYGGESFPPIKLNELLKKAPNSKISNVYGPAEVNQCTYFTISKPIEADKEVPIGQVWENTSYLILNSEGQQVAPGEQGEFLVHSVTMMSGYWNNETLNQKSFYIDRKEGKEVNYYRTGDYVYLNKNNELVFVGRMDRQVKINGYRIELGAIEQVLIQCPEVKDVAVFTCKSNGMRELCAAIVPKEKPLDNNSLRKRLIKLLPKTSIPKHFFEVQSLPHSVNGKVHYRKLEKQFSN